MNFTAKYTLQSRLATDKSVFKAQTKRGQDVCIKIEKMDAELKLLAHEAKMYAALRHTNNVLPLKWFGRYEDQFVYIVLPFIEYSLHDLIQSGKLFQNASIVENIATQIFNGIKAIHERDIVHRDLKPDNILIRSSGDLYIIDFGLATRYRICGEHIRPFKTHDIIGTVEYVSVNVHEKLTPMRRDDLISIGYILLECYNGKLPWRQSSLQQQKLFKENIQSQLCCLSDTFLQNIGQYLKLCRNLKFAETLGDYCMLHK